MDQQTKALQQALHISEYETRVYIATLEMTDCSVTDLGEATGISRTAVYPPIQSLLKRGLLSKVTVGKRVKYQAIPPESLLSLHDRDRVTLKQTIEQLTHQISLPSQGMSVRYFPGLNGLVQAANIFLDNSKNAALSKTIENADLMAERVSEPLFDEYIERRVQKGIFSRTIIPAEPVSEWVRKTKDKDAEQLRRTIFVSPRSYPIESSFAVCGDMVLLLNAHHVASGTLIRNAAIARTFESMHDMIWDRFAA